MRINSLSYSNYNKFNYYNNNNSKAPAFKGQGAEQASLSAVDYNTVLPKSSSFWAGLFIKDPNKNYFTEFISQKGKVSKNSYRDIGFIKRGILNRKAKEYVNSNLTPKDKVEPQTIAKSAIVLKRYFDNKYGKNGYRIISLGTSPAAITQAMEYLDTEVIYLPVTGLAGSKDNSTCEKPEYYFENFKNMTTLMKYLAQKGIKKGDDKVNVVVDYCITKRTLNTVTDCIKQYFGLDEDSIMARGIIEAICIANLYERDEKIKPTDDEIKKLDSVISEQDIEKIANVPHFYLDDRDNIGTSRAVCALGRKPSFVFKKFEDFSRPLSRAYSICLLEELSKLTSGFLK